MEVIIFNYSRKKVNGVLTLIGTNNNLVVAKNIEFEHEKVHEVKLQKYFPIGLQRVRPVNGYKNPLRIIYNIL